MKLCDGGDIMDLEKIKNELSQNQPLFIGEDTAMRLRSLFRLFK